MADKKRTPSGDKKLNHATSMPNLHKKLVRPVSANRNPDTSRKEKELPSLPKLRVDGRHLSAVPRPQTFRPTGSGQSTPLKTSPVRHQPKLSISESVDSYNLSVIDMYHDAASIVSPTTDVFQSLMKLGIHGYEDDFTDNYSSSSVSVADSPRPRVHADDFHFTDHSPSRPHFTDQSLTNLPYLFPSPTNLLFHQSQSNHILHSSPGRLLGSHSTLSLLSSRDSANIIRNSIELSKTSLSASRDRYGFKKKSQFVSEAAYNAWWSDYSKYLVRRKRKWELLMKQSGLTYEHDAPVRFPARSEKVKRYIRKGIPAEWRGHAWFHYARGHEKLAQNAGVYDAIVASTIDLHNKDTEIIERDLNRTFPDNLHFRSDETQQQRETETPLVQALRRVLVAFSQHLPTIGYCQSLNFLAGMLLVFMDEERAFWMLVIITQKYLPGVHDLNLEGVNVDQGVLMLCIKEYLPEMWARIGLGLDGEKLTDGNLLVRLPPVTLCTASWFMSGFIGVLPFETVLRVWDCIFFEESKTLFRISVALFDMVSPEVTQIRDQMEIFQAIQNFPKKIINPNELFDHCFKKRNGIGHYLSQEEVNKCRDFVSKQRRSHAENAKMYVLDGEGERLYDFEHRKGLNSVAWNKNLTLKMKRLRKSD
ncbi:hypothetical protein BABINDRAFT_159442 [Babjeviella inositovora NRRL Y-12698]|uniref:Rab-GAP TBC domain-containing protein n=1 Tax=Babjeviella inositovora NRRL Y-12698 TaxID=984486 RepID=A0A1E3QZ60_9ASCO|nr:uncharacterized protein BABINDRAFT_159442 [Babjeviella inositovora NRRL Y-12698]ODQ82963.1 hypothetical protein BABINDRAFT_159442 [Babjeviella inositovora NRRL Y-12698]